MGHTLHLRVLLQLRGLVFSSGVRASLGCREICFAIGS